MNKQTDFSKAWILGGSLALFLLLAIGVTYPIVFKLDNFLVLDTAWPDESLQSWTLAWDIHALLSGATGLRNIWNANIFYPYPTTLAFSEHLFPTAFLLMPFILLGKTPLVATSIGMILTTALSGWGVYLLVTWLSGNRWAGLVAGIAFAIAPFRLSHLTQLHLLSTQWLPFIFLAMGRLIKFNRPVDLLLLIIFTNLQFLGVINYAPLIALAMGIWAIFGLYANRQTLTRGLFVKLLVWGVVTLALNWPMLRIYQQVSQQMGIVRNLGDAKLYGASWVNYLLPIGNSLLYGRWLGLPTHIDYKFSGIGVFLTAFPGLMVLILAGAAIVLLTKSPKINSLALLTIAAVGFVLSFGANDEAFGKSLAPITAKLLPYTYLYYFVPILQGLRIPLRFALLTTFGLTVLAGLGFANLSKLLRPTHRQTIMATVLVSSFIIMEHLPAPLPGGLNSYGAPGYTWLAQNSAPDSTLIELPYYLHTKQSHQEVVREYQSVNHWRRLVNGNSGFKPAGLVELGHVLDAFPDWRSFDLLRQLGINYLVLHQNQYEPTAWQNLLGLLPLYWPSIESLHTADQMLILKLHPPTCHANTAQISLSATAWPTITLTNGGAATWTTDPRRASSLDTGREFLEPLFVLPGDTVTFALPTETTNKQAHLNNLGQTITTPSMVSPKTEPVSLTNWQPIQVAFTNKAVLQAMAIGTTAAGCGELTLQLKWKLPTYANERVRVEVIDKFGRLTLKHEATFIKEVDAFTSTHRLPIAETVPAGMYQLRLHLLTSDGAEISAVNSAGQVVKQPLALPLIIRPAPKTNLPTLENRPAPFVNGITLLGSNPLPNKIKAGEWLRFTLVWQAQAPQKIDYTVFTQLLGADGRVWGQQDNQPKGGLYGTSLWAVGETVEDDYAIRLDPTAPAGDYRLIVGMYEAASGQRVNLDPQADFVAVGSIGVTLP